MKHVYLAYLRIIVALNKIMIRKVYTMHINTSYQITLIIKKIKSVNIFLYKCIWKVNDVIYIYVKTTECFNI